MFLKAEIDKGGYKKNEKQKIMKSVSTITVQVIISVIVFIANTVMPLTVTASGDLVASCRSKAKMLCIEHHHHHRQSPDKEVTVTRTTPPLYSYGDERINPLELEACITLPDDPTLSASILSVL